ncbi:hypothetical protein KBB25_00085 [Candidatus Gracilibacteria bacterium]|nr:hypothetical protein [Candidatus Gracilibacteria bacterium]
MNSNILIAKKGHIPFFSERKSAREHYRLNFTQTYILAIIMIACLGVYYVWVLNENATKGYNIRTLQTKNRELSFQENLLDIRIAEGQSIGTIMTSPIVSTMQNVDKTTFLVIKGTDRLQKE